MMEGVGEKLGCVIKCVLTLNIPCTSMCIRLKVGMPSLVAPYLANETINYDLPLNQVKDPCRSRLTKYCKDPPSRLGDYKLRSCSYSTKKLKIPVGDEPQNF